MGIAFGVLFLVVLLFGLGAIFGAPYLPTLKKEGDVALDLLNLKKGQTILDLGSGDGSFLLQAAKRGLKGIGWEINPLLVVFSKLRLWRYRKTVHIHWLNMWNKKLPNTDAIYIFGIGRYMGKFAKKFEEEITTSTKVVCFTFTIPGKSPAVSKRGVRLYLYR